MVGGKLSEGINFSDNLGRGVVLIGMPYPNKGSMELQEKMNYIDKKHTQSPIHYKLTGNIYYESLCLKRINQSIGRAVRHKDDYACIILVDQRYTMQKVNSKISGWIMRSYQNVSDTMKINDQIIKFFEKH